MTDLIDKERYTFFTKKQFVTMLVVFVVLRLVSMALLPLFDPSEARYATMGKNMAVTGNFLEPQFIYKGVFQVFEGKPPLFFQAGGWACRLFGVCEFAVRLPGFLSAVFIMLFVYFTVKTLKDEETARLATLLCAATPVFFVFAGLSMTDLMLAASVVGGVMSYMLFSSGKSKSVVRSGSLLFFACMGLGMVIKGPVALVMACLPILLYIILNKRWKDLKNHSWLLGIVIFLAISVPWFALMAAKNPDFLEYFFINENIKRFLIKDYGDRYGSGRESFRGMAFVFFLACNAPFLIYGVISLINRRFRKPFFSKALFFGNPLVSLSLLTIISNTLFWCLTSRVLITYLLPTIPMTAIFLAEMLVETSGQHSEKWNRSVRILANTMIILAGVVMLLATYVGPHFSQKLPRDFFLAGASLEEYKSYPCYIIRNAPYSAEFYLGDRVINNLPGGESFDESLERSKGALLFVTAHDFNKSDRKPEDMTRKLLLKHGFWYLYAPETILEAPVEKQQ